MKWLLVALLALGNMPALCQKFVVANAKQNVVYLGVPNPIDVAVEGRFCKDLIVTTDNGNLEADDSPCSYLLRPDSIGRATITILSRSAGNKPIGSMVFRVKRIPDPVASIGFTGHGGILPNELRAKLGIMADLRNFDYDALFRVTHFTVIISRAGRAIFTQTCEGQLFPPEVKAAFDHIVTQGDSVFFEDIRCKGPDGLVRNIGSLVIKVL